MSILQSLLAFFVVIGILVTIHEFGHYWVAKKLGVKILRFSVGFGYVLFSKRLGQDRTEFALSAIPLGGYVSMLDEREGEVEEHERHRAFNRQPLWIRSAIVVAGPLANLLFAIFIYAVMYMIGVTGSKALVGNVDPDSVAAQAGFEAKQQIIAVDHESTLRWESVLHTTLNKLLDNPQTINYTVQDEDLYQQELQLNVADISIDDLAEGNFFDKLGLHPYRPTIPAIMGDIFPESAAERAGLQKDDKILSLDGQMIEDWFDWADYISARPDTDVHAEIERHGKIIQLTLRPENKEGRGLMGVYAPKNDIPKDLIVVEHYGLGDAFLLGIKKTWDVSVLTLRLFGKMLTAQVSVKNISGPVSIAEYAGKTAQLGIVTFLGFLGLVSVSLGILNLLPIPLLDGGHLFLYGIEWLKGSPLAENTQYILQQIGLVLLLSLMGLAIFNDLGRLLN